MTPPRRQILISLVELDRPLEEILPALAGLSWDSEEELVVLGPAQVIEILRRYLAGALAAGDVERWANAVEGREDIALALQHRALLAEAIFDLANPVLQGPLTPDVAKRWIARLGATDRK